MDDVLPLKTIGLQIKVLQSQMKSMDERIKSNATREDIASCKEENRLANLRTDETVAGIEIIRKDMFYITAKINSMGININSNTSGRNEERIIDGGGNVLIDHEDCSTPNEDVRNIPGDYVNLEREFNPPGHVPASVPQCPPNTLIELDLVDEAHQRLYHDHNDPERTGDLI